MHIFAYSNAFFQHILLSYCIIFKPFAYNCCICIRILERRILHMRRCPNHHPVDANSQDSHGRPSQIKIHNKQAQ